MPPFFQRVYQLLAQVPSGRVVTYGQIARALGAPQGARAVGWAMRHCPEHLPWHRVINARGDISPRSADSHIGLQRALLEEEGIRWGPSGHIDLNRYGWDGF